MVDFVDVAPILTHQDTYRGLGSGIVVVGLSRSNFV